MQARILLWPKLSWLERVDAGILVEHPLVLGACAIAGLLVLPRAGRGFWLSARLALTVLLFIAARTDWGDLAPVGARRGH